MDVTITTTGDGDDLRSLRAWLVRENELRGRVSLPTAPPKEGTLGSVVEVLLAAVGSGGAITVLVSGLISWLRHRSQDVTLEITRADGASIKIDAKRVRDVSLKGLQDLTGTYTGFLEGRTEPEPVEKDA